MAGQAANELLSTQKASDSGLKVVLHPLPILEISDFIVRGYQRGLKGAVVGALLGQQNGHEVTIEHSFSCKSEKNADGLYKLDDVWFGQRLEQMKLVHKSPALDLVGWYSLVPKTGPSALHLPIHRQISALNESAVLLGFHVEDMLAPSSGDPLPITIYESNMEAEDSKEAEGEDQEMKDAEAAARMVLRFRKLPYATDTGEAEMIAMQFIREGGANATVDSTEKHILEQFDKKIAVDDGKGKRRAVAYEESSKSKKEASTSTEQPASNPDANLSRAEAEYMSALQAKYNAIKMMKSRLALIITYLQNLPSDFTSGTQTTAEAADLARASNGQHTIPSNNILRHIQALVTNADLVAPAEQATLEREIQRETNDVNLISMVSDLVSSMNEAREAGKKFHIAESTRHTRQGRAMIENIAQLEQSKLIPGYDMPGLGVSPAAAEY
ncbi:uncharacterized protein B0H64DRAFT_176959 [Chaetomium fimeti]|uniref:COP9 signalosome complex subunit 6 n=1 Tax=Chaetomium fimeti TaxID=1854472 RepID=A0AAE0LRA2_9PEZI|nr:hypothetical protein B0H64DRAFT_176959 [Chaetomium fimeti]